MEREGYVSLWIGIIDSDFELSKYLELGYTDDGDYIPSQFLTDFNIDLDEFDEEFTERNFAKNLTDSIIELIKGCSYEDVVLEKFQDLYSDTCKEKLNSAFLLYNFQFDENIKQIKTDKYYFRFVGSIKYLN